MSSHCLSIVPKRSYYPNNELKAKEILNWLISEDIVESMPSDCVLGSEVGYALSEGARKATPFPDFLPFSLNTNGLEIVLKRSVFDTGQNGMEKCICPNCKENIALESWEFFNEWFNEVSNNLRCPLCKLAADIHQYSFTPEWGFSNLGFRFWNWPEFTEEFIKTFRKKLECEVSIIDTHI